MLQCVVEAVCYPLDSALSSAPPFMTLMVRSGIVLGHQGLLTQDRGNDHDSLLRDSQKFDLSWFSWVAVFLIMRSWDPSI